MHYFAPKKILCQVAHFWITGQQLHKGWRAYGPQSVGQEVCVFLLLQNSSGFVWMIWKYEKSAPEQTPSCILLTLKPILLMLMTGSSHAHGRVRLYNELHQGHRDARIGQGIFSLFFCHINGTNSSLKGLLPDLHLIDGLGVHEPSTWACCIGYCWIGKGLLREWSESLYTSLS